jgi:hypothetical protein
VALDLVRRSLREFLRTGAGSRGLCHGACGKAAVLMEGGARDPLLFRTAAAALEWEDRDDDGEPGLFLGRAGIGMFLLDLAGMSRLCPLLLSPEDP